MNRLVTDAKTRLDEGGATPWPDSALWSELAGTRSPEAFSQHWLSIQCRLIDRVTGGVVMLGPGDRGPFLVTAAWPDPTADNAGLREVASAALRDRRGTVSSSAEPDVGAKSGLRRVALPLMVGNALRGVVALELEGRPPHALQHALRQLYWGSGRLEAAVSELEGERLQRGVDRLVANLEIVSTALDQSGFDSAARAVVNDLATHFRCDRASLGWVSDGHCKVVALSHSADLSDKANISRAIGEAMDEAIDQASTIVMPARSTDAARVMLAHRELVRRTGDGALVTIPLGAGTSAPFAALTLERHAQAAFDEGEISTLETAALLLAPLLALHRENDRGMRRRVADATRRWGEALVGPGHVVAKLAMLAGVLLVALLAFGRGDFEVAADARIEGQTRRVATAPFEGYIATAPSRAGDAVKAGQVLAEIDDRDLRVEQRKWEGRRGQVAAQLRDAMSAQDLTRVAVLSAQLEQAEAELAYVEEQLERTRIIAPFDGFVVSGDLSQSLGAPVDRGQVLFELAPLEAYRVQIEVDEGDIDDVSPGAQGRLVLSSMAESTFPIVVTRVTPVAEAKDKRNVFLVEARLAVNDARLRPNMQGVAKVEAGERRLGWIWTRRITDWIRLKTWRWLP